MSKTVDRVVCEDRKVTVLVRTVARTDGTTEEKVVIVHPGAVVILALTEDESMVFIRNHRVALGETLLELPAGTLEPSEDPLLCAHRELQEETGYEAARLEPLCEFVTAPGFCTERMFAFEAYDLTHVGQALEPDEDITVELIPIEEVFERMRSGAIQDGKTLAALAVFFAKKPIK